ncbi:MAG: type IVB secretion system protein IcmH/DotU [Bacillota bacterium]
MNVSVQSKTSKKRKTLSDIASDFLILILQLRAINNYGSAVSLKSKVSEMLEDFEREAKEAGFDYEKIQQSIFAIVAFLDETIIGSEWEQKTEWISEPLQLKLFDTFNAGEVFFNNIKLLRQRTAANKDVLEVYYLSLVLGFKGKFQLQSPETLRKVIDELNSELHPQMFDAIDAISPHAKSNDVFNRPAKHELPVWIYPAAALLLSVLFYVFLSFNISAKANSIIEQIMKYLS